MGKRSDFPHLPQDAYATPLAAVAPLLEQLEPCTQFIEPCCGDGFLVGHLKREGHVCVGAFDLPHDTRVKRYEEAKRGIVFITNPPWRRDVLHQIIANLTDQAPAWLLIDADWLFTKQASPYLPCLRVVAVIGRVKWIPGSPFTGKDSCAWCLFDRPRSDGRAVIRFVGRSSPSARLGECRSAA